MRIDTPPYYIAATGNVITSTYGGITANADMAVLDLFGERLPACSRQANWSEASWSVVSERDGLAQGRDLRAARGKIRCDVKYLSRQRHIPTAPNVATGRKGSKRMSADLKDYDNLIDGYVHPADSLQGGRPRWTHSSDTSGALRAKDLQNAADLDDRRRCYRDSVRRIRQN